MKTPIIFRNCITFTLFMTVLIVAASAYADVVVVVSAKSSVSRLTTEQAANIFLGKVDTFPNNGKAFPITQTEGSEVRNEFYAKVANMDSSQVAAHWSRIIFSGKGVPPKLLNGNEAVRNAVAYNPNAIGYIDKSAVDSSVKIVLQP